MGGYGCHYTYRRKEGEWGSNWEVGEGIGTRLYMIITVKISISKKRRGNDVKGVRKDDSGQLGKTVVVNKEWGVGWILPMSLRLSKGKSLR